MVRVTRLYAAYTLLGGVIARLFVNQEIINFRNDFQASLVILISITTIITGLLVLLSLHLKINYFVFWIYSFILPRIPKRFKKSDTPDLNLIRQTMQGSHFSDTLDYFWGNTILIWTMSTILCFLIDPLIKDRILIPVIDTKIILNISFFPDPLLFALLGSILILSYDWGSSYKESRKRLDWCKLYTCSSRYSQPLKKYKKVKAWYSDYLEDINRRWHVVTEKYTSRKDHLESRLNDLIQELENQNEDPRLFNPSIIKEMIVQLQIRGIDAFISPERTKFLTDLSNTDLNSQYSWDIQLIAEIGELRNLFSLNKVEVKKESSKFKGIISRIYRNLKGSKLASIICRTLISFAIFFIIGLFTSIIFKVVVFYDP